MDMKNAGIRQQTTLIVTMYLLLFTNALQSQNMYLMKGGAVILKQSIAIASVDSIIYYEPAHAVITTTVSSIGTSTATSGGSIVDYVGATVSARGVCWSTNTLPTIALPTKTSDGTGTGGFSSALTGLAGSTKYYVRAYATNSIGVTSYGAEVNFTTPITDIDGNVYSSVTIGSQTWMVENLKTTHYRDGSLIANVTDNTAWAALNIGAWSDYDNSGPNGTKYGHLYNWYAASDARNLAPVGWHIPTDEEWTNLVTYLDINGGGKLKETSVLHLNRPNVGATNESGFTALLGGFRDFPGQFYDNENCSFWWSSTVINSTNAWCRLLCYDSSIVERHYLQGTTGCYIRCIKD